MTNRRKVIPVLAALLVLLAGCGQLSTSSEQDDAFAPTEAATQALAWSIDTLDVTGWIYGPTAMAVGKDGTRHIAFVEAYDDVVMYVSDETGSWSASETVGSSNAMAVSMAIDSQDVPHVSYVEPDGALAYATPANGDWSSPADTVSPYATQVSLALDDSGTPHLAYVDSNGLQYAVGTSEGWSASTVLAKPATGDVTSGALALDREGHPHVAIIWTEYAYVTGYTVRLGYAEATFDADGQVSWQPLTVIAVYNFATTSGTVALALDGSDHPHVAYRSGSGTLMYVRHDGSDWGTPETVLEGDSFDPSMALDSSGNPHVAFRVQPVRYGPHTVYYGMRSDTGWSTEVVDDEGDAGPASLALDASGQPHISYSYNDGDTGTLKVATVASAPSDTTPPVITPVVVPASPDGADGWYASTVTVSWSVVDDESDATETAGCEPVTIDVDTLGTTLTCRATSAGGTSTESITIKRDATSPVVSVTGVEAGVTYTPWDVPEAGCMTSDATSGVEVFATMSLAGGPSGAITVSCLGASDYAGNEGSASVTYDVMDAYAGVEALIDKIEQLQDEGVLKGGQAKGLITPLKNALRSLKKGDSLDACNQLGDFVMGVEAKVPPLTVAQADDLIGSAEAIREMLGCP